MPARPYRYDTFGAPLTHIGTSSSSYLYTGQQYNAASGLYNLRARSYDPTIGRFLSADTYPINYQNPAEFNRYVYTANNPVNFSDPSGYTLTERVQLDVATGGPNNKPRRMLGAAMGGSAGAAVAGILYAVRGQACGSQYNEQSCRVTVAAGAAFGAAIGAYPELFPKAVKRGLLGASAARVSGDFFAALFLSDSEALCGALFDFTLILAGAGLNNIPGSPGSMLQLAGGAIFSLLLRLSGLDWKLVRMAHFCSGQASIFGHLQAEVEVPTIIILPKKKSRR